MYNENNMSDKTIYRYKNLTKERLEVNDFGVVEPEAEIESDHLIENANLQLVKEYTKKDK